MTDGAPLALAVFGCLIMYMRTGGEMRDAGFFLLEHELHKNDGLFPIIRQRIA